MLAVRYPMSISRAKIMSSFYSVCNALSRISISGPMIYRFMSQISQPGPIGKPRRAQFVIHIL
jgi:hypothetical protein